MILESLVMWSSLVLAQGPIKSKPYLPKTMDPTPGQTHAERLGPKEKPEITRQGGDPTKEESDGFSIEIFNKTSYDTNARAFDILGSHVGLEWDFTGYGFDRFRRDPQHTVYGVKFDFSGIPLLLHESVEDDLDKAIAQKVDRGLANNAPFQSLPQWQQMALRQQYIETAKSTQHDRLDYAAQFETTAQQLAFSTGLETGNRSILFIDVGKLCVHGGPLTDSNGFTSGEFVRPTNNPVQRALDSMGTGACHINWGAYGGTPEFREIQDIYSSIGADLWVFHERMPFVSGRQFLGTLAQYSEAEFEEHKDWWKLDSALLRFSANMDILSAYLSTGYFDGEMGYGLGGSFALRDEKFNKTWSVSVDTTYSDRDRGLQGGFSAQVNRHLVDERLALYGLYSTGNNMYSWENDRKFDFNEVGAGLSYTCPVDFIAGKRANFQIAGECIAGDLDDDSGKNIGGRLSVFFEVPF